MNEIRPRTRSAQDIYTPPGGPPQGSGPSREVYGLMGAENIYKMLEDFYAELEQSSIRSMFPEDMKTASRKSACFFIQLLGGPPLFQELYGPPQMRARHFRFTIDEEGRLVWLNCFKRVLEKAEEAYAFPPQHLPGFIRFLEDFSAWMVNAQGDQRGK